MTKLVASLAVLAVAGLASTNALADDASAKALYQKSGCIACHTLDGAGGKIGPGLEKIGAKGKDYIKEAIVAPNKVVTQGFAPGIMPQDFGKRLKPAEINDMVDWLAKKK